MKDARALFASAVFGCFAIIILFVVCWFTFLNTVYSIHIYRDYRYCVCVWKKQDIASVCVVVCVLCLLSFIL